MENNYFLGLSEEGFHKVVYTEWGEPYSTDNTIICVHGLTRNRHDFDYLAHFLAERRYHLFCPDIVGRGDSDWLKNPQHYTYEQYVADLNALIARTRVKTLHWIGTSMGGILGMVLASLPNTPIKSLVLNDIGPQVAMKGLVNLGKYVGKMPEFSSMDEAVQYFRTIHAPFGKLSDEQWQHLTESSIREVNGRFVSKIDQGIHALPSKSKIAWQLLSNPLKALQGTFFDIDLWYIWNAITCPVLVLHGQQSDLLMPEVVKKMQQSRGNVDVIEIPEAGHAPALFDPMQHEVIYQWLMNRNSP